MRGPSLFKKRRITTVIEQMNAEAKKEFGIDGQIATSDWNQGYAVVSAFDPSDVRKNKAYKILYDVYAPKIDAALKVDNPFREIVAGATSLALWEAGSFLVGERQLKTGNYSPYYIDVAKIFSSPDYMNMISSFFQIEYERCTNGADIIVGGGIARHSCRYMVCKRYLQWYWHRKEKTERVRHKKQG